MLGTWHDGGVGMPRPIFIIGCPRSGTTVTLHIMGCHEQVAWVSDFLNRSPARFSTIRRNRLYDLPHAGIRLYLARTQGPRRALPGRLMRHLPVPMEAWSFWNEHLPGFTWEEGGNTPPRRRTADDMSSERASAIRDAVRAICHHHCRERFLSKYTDFPRIRYLSRAFPDALFVHVLRDGRAVAASYLERIERAAFQAWHWNTREWWTTGWPQAWRTQWAIEGETPASFVAFQWKFFVNQIRQDADAIAGEQRYLEVRYGDIIRSPASTFQRIFEFCDLPASRRVDWYLERVTLHDMNVKWRARFSDQERRMLSRVIHEPALRELCDDSWNDAVIMV